MRSNYRLEKEVAYLREQNTELRLEVDRLTALVEALRDKVHELDSVVLPIRIIGLGHT